MDNFYFNKNDNSGLKWLMYSLHDLNLGNKLYNFIFMYFT
jgi:hypothetical protein